MSVPKSKRKESPIKFFDTLIKIRKELRKQMSENFGLKVNASEAAREIYKIYGCYIAYNSDYTTFELATLRVDIKHCLRKLVSELTFVISTDIKIHEELVECILRLDKAYSFCEELLQLLQELVEDLPADSNRLMPITGLIIEEEDLIKSTKSRLQKEFKNIL